MSIPTEEWKKWEGRLVDGKFPLRQWLGGSDHSAVFLTQRGEISAPKTTAKKVIIKLIAAENPEATVDTQRSRWAEAARLSRPDLIQLFEYGRCEIDGVSLLYVVMEYAEENLAEIIPIRPLTADETLAMLHPAAEALSFLHESGWVHCHIKPSNILAVADQLKLSTDSLRKVEEKTIDEKTIGEQTIDEQKIGERTIDGNTTRVHAATFTPDAYQAPEAKNGTFTPASDVWSLGRTLLAVLTQSEPQRKSDESDKSDPAEIAIPLTIPQPLRGIVQQCLHIDPAKRVTAKDIQQQLSRQPLQDKRPAATNLATGNLARATTRSNRWLPVSVVVVVLLLAAWFARRFVGHQAPNTPSEVPHEASQPDTAATASPAPSSPPPFSPKKPSPSGLVRGSVLKQVMPDVSAGSLHTISGRLKVSVSIMVDASGNVSEAKLTSPGPSRYFAGHALAAARQWKFTPAQMDGNPSPSQWLLHFRFSRRSVDVTPAETKP